jgi:hypothetical protein
MHCQGNHPNGLVPLKRRILARMAFFGQDNRFSVRANMQMPLCFFPTGAPDIRCFSFPYGAISITV